MPSHINKKTIEHLAELARLELGIHEEEILLRDLEKILAHFEELKELDTSNVQPMTGGTSLMNRFREDDGARNTNQGAGTESFPDSHKEFLVVPPVFE